MEFDRTRRASHIPNLTPLIDIVFLLLIFFMLTAHFVQDETIKIDLPTAESSDELNEEEIIKIVVNKDGEIFLGDKPVDIFDLEQRLTIALESRKNKSVQIRGDSDSNLSVTVAILDSARKAGADNVDIVTKRP